MTKHFCDICGRELKSSSCPINPFLSFLVHSEDVCDDCKVAFKKWADSRKPQNTETEKE